MSRRESFQESDAKQPEPTFVQPDPHWKSRLQQMHKNFTFDQQDSLRDLFKD